MEYGKKTENHGKWDTSTRRLEKWRNHWKTWKWEMHKVGPGIERENWKSRKMRITLVRYWNMTRFIEKHEKWEMHTLGPGIWQANWKSPKWEIHTLGLEICQGKLKKLENLEMSTVGHAIWQENWKSWKIRIIH